MSEPVARKGDPISHGGVIIEGDSTFKVNGIDVARVGDLALCSMHGPQPIVQGSSTVKSSGKEVSYRGALIACGAVISDGSPDTNVGT